MALAEPRVTYTPAQRAAAVRLAERVGYKAAARRLGIAYTTVYRWKNPGYAAQQRASSLAAKHRRRGVCLDCGAETRLNDRGVETYPNGASLYCVACAADRIRVWTRDRVIDAIRDFADQYGHPPGAMEWNPALARAQGHPELAERFARDGCWPHLSTVMAYHGSWNAAIRAAGFEPLLPGHRRHGDQQSWNRDAIVAAMRRWARTHGEPPRFAEWSRTQPGYPTGHTVTYHFGSWNAAVEAAGLTPRVQGRGGWT